ncbi:hypothetical protein MY7_3726 [Bacillus sp. 5B6]|nr:hypothetical protein MY7_3726 [Bacillus sp. 5B6]
MKMIYAYDLHIVIKFLKICKLYIFLSQFRHIMKMWKNYTQRKEAK